ncbi:hypothetical protein NLX67_17835 [Domibacillus sp. A3M-37]|uniref:hypothetical protein n=1 Tax=Domibacillus TaxID=1433999 RepID=UPI0020B8DB44|nr:hypothetical protein [Domibacillus sp. A3M-37]MCP3764210.1 hypothetical protein [Domibacillus sp. A3M-37]
MEVSMSIEEVMNQISELKQRDGEQLRKKQIKKSHPELMKNALYHFPNWEAAIETTGEYSSGS